MRQKVWRRLYVWAGVLGFSALALSSGIDRLAERHPSMARAAPFSGGPGAHRAQAAEALEEENHAAAIAAARQAVLFDPVDPRSAALLGAALLSSGEQASADRAFRVAARFGWRDPLTQLYFMDQALLMGDWHLAATRLDAVLRQDPAFPLRDMLLARFEASAEGRAALGKRLALRPSWLATFAASDLPSPVLLNRSKVLAAMPGPGLGCDTITPLVGSLVAAADVHAAKELWAVHCPRSSAGIADPGFAQIATILRTAPFDWNPIGAGDVALQTNRPPGSGMTARVSASSSRAVLWQMLTLAPGRYRLSWTAKSPSGAAANAVFFTLACKLGEGTPLRAEQQPEGDRFEASLHVDGACPGQYLTLWLAPTDQDISVEPLVLEPLP